MRTDRDSTFFSDLDAPETPRTALKRRDIRRRARRRNRAAMVLVAPVALAGTFYLGFNVLGGGGKDAAQLRSAPQDDVAAPTTTPAPSSPRSQVEAPQAPALNPGSPRKPDGDAPRTQARTPVTTKPTPPKVTVEPPAPPRQQRQQQPEPTTKPPAALPKTAVATGTRTADNAAETEVLRLVNVERGKAGCKPVKADATLTKVARAHSKDMAVNGFFSHETPDGTNPFERMSAAGYSYSWAAENIAAGQRTAADVMDSWMKSQGHRTNILNCKLTELGVGMWKQPGSQYGVYWTQDFGTPR